jgi:hypothetical protein
MMTEGQKVTVPSMKANQVGFPIGHSHAARCKSPRLDL